MISEALDPVSASSSVAKSSSSFSGAASPGSKKIFDSVLLLIIHS